MTQVPIQAPIKFKKRKIIFLAIAGVFLLLVTMLLVTGYFAEVAYTGSVSKVIHAPVDKVWSLLNDTKRFTANRHEVRSVEIMPDDPQGMKRWREHTMLAGDMHYTTTDIQPEQLLVIKMTESDFGMNGTWAFKLSPVGDYTQVTITEKSLTEGLIMRSILNTLGRNANMHLLQKAIEDGIKKLQDNG